jgi:hypothetical protein
MYPTSAAFQAALLASHEAIFRVDVLSNGATIASLSTNQVRGNITVDTTAAVQRSGNIQFVDPTGNLVPLVATDELTPYGNELRIWRGINLATGPEWVPVITGGIFDTIIEENGTGGFTITCDIFDRSRLVTLNPFTDVYSITNGTNTAVAIQGIVANRLPTAMYATMSHTYVSTGATTPAVIYGASGANDPWKSVSDLATSAGLFVSFDPLGNDSLIPIPSPTSVVPVASFVEGSNLVTVRRRLTAEATFNGVVATGQNTSSTAPYRGVAWDTDASSPTFYLGPFGMRPTFFTSPLINSNGAALAAATGQLALNLGGTEIVSFGTIVNPALAGYDVVQVQRTRVGIPLTRYLIQSFNVPLDVSTPMDAVCRVRRV